MSKVIYLKHPVSPEDKAKHRSEGFKIVDERFKPEEVEAVKPKRKRKTKE